MTWQWSALFRLFFAQSLLYMGSLALLKTLLHLCRRQVDHLVRHRGHETRRLIVLESRFSRLENANCWEPDLTYNRYACWFTSVVWNSQVAQSSRVFESAGLP
ncbi:hypothetical protein BDW02DRAFT_271622 [Decorospora gaudefroyi]|uniref:Uncharacterized protein n=1 Tax=Decorospora gaudefroyi TaxID=184978 RepID=A0A6A5K173_9PLEO|nr:hypothetical protein BDW02DRAFT_271622 [Decorospora gaudefroyi]